MSGRPDSRAVATRLLVMAIVSGILVGGGLVPLRASAAEQQGQRSLAERLCGLRWWDNREKTELRQVVRDRSDRKVAEEVARHAASGNAVAQCALGLLYDEGRGVPQDFVLAYMWTSLAASQESRFADLRDQIALKMTPQQMAEAQRLAREWKPRTSAPAERLEGVAERPAASHGTGFVVSRQGHVLTANHVVAGCRTIQAFLEGRTLPLTVVASDPTNDAAVLKLLEPLPHTARFRAGRSIQPGEGVVVIGFPLAGLLAAQPQVTTGVVSALAGIQNDTRLLQITAPVQPGNSGGPLLDQRGAVVGMVVSKLDARQLEKLTGDLPQNVNFALTGAMLKAVLDAVPVAYEESASSRPMETADLAEQARRFTLALECR